MAKLMLIGHVADVEIISPGEPGNDAGDETTKAVCRVHRGLAPSLFCDWTAEYDGLYDATEYAQDHADRGDMRR